MPKQQNGVLAYAESDSEIPDELRGRDHRDSPGVNARRHAIEQCVLLGAAMTAGTFRLCEITGSELVPRTLRLRYEVWSTETTLRPDVVAQGLITDEHDAHARHWAVLGGDDMVAAARMCIHKRQEDSPESGAFASLRLPLPVATLNRLVVHQTARRLGLARTMDECRIMAAKKDGAKCVVGTAAHVRIRSLERLGFCRLEGQEQWTQHYTECVSFHAMVLYLQ